jgi:aryl-alcohol dehydrogenase-like predicted oxidoreductase
LGCVRLGSVGGGLGGRESIRLVHAAIDLGVRYFDTADAYGAGSSERILGRALRGRRDRVALATKGGYRFGERSALECRLRAAAAPWLRRLRTARPRTGNQGSGGGYADQDFTPAYLTTALEASLRRLGTDHVEVYQLHAPRHADRDAVAEWATTQISQGKIGCLGIGAEELSQAGEWLTCAAVGSIQVPFGLLDAEAGNEVIPRGHASGRAVVARSVLGGGVLTHPELVASEGPARQRMLDDLRSTAAEAGMGLATLAVRFVASRPDVDTVLVGTTSRGHLAEMADAVGGPPLDAALVEALESMVAA